MKVGQGKLVVKDTGKGTRRGRRRLSEEEEEGVGDLSSSFAHR